MLLLRYAEGSASTTERERGFLEELHTHYPAIALVSADQYAGPTRETAKRASENLLNRYSGDVQGIFTPNESSTIGMLLALQDVGLAGKVRFIGFDAARTLIDAVRARQLDGVVVQNPMRMGYLGVKTLADRLRGKPVERLIDTGVMLVTAANLDSAAAQAVSRRAMSAGATGPVLELRDIAKRFGATEALAGVDLTLSAGEVHALIGENGAGKSTLMSVVAGALEPDRGEMRVDGRPYAPRTPLEARRRGIALIHQELSLCPHLSAAENILLGAEPARWGWLDAPAARRRAQALLDHFAHPDLTPDARVGDLPLAARQVVEICRALAADARILLMDEPTSSFQRVEIDRLFALIRRLAAHGIAVIYISHFLEEVREIAGRYTILRDGRGVDTGSIAGAGTGRLIEQMVGRPVAGLFPERAPTRAEEALLVVHDIAAPPALKHASFELSRGEILGIAGLAGSGRSELVRALFGLEPAVAGRIVLRGRTLAAPGARPARRLGQGFGYLSEDRTQEGLTLGLSVADNLTATRLSACARRWGWLDLGAQGAAARTWIDALRVRAASPWQPIRALSGGNQQKVAIGRLLFQDADVLLLDEPTRGIDIGSRAQIYETIVRSAAQGKAVLLVSSYLPELFGLCHRLAVMSRGRLSPARPVEDWTPEAVLATAIGGAPNESA